LVPGELRLEFLVLFFELRDSLSVTASSREMDDISINTSIVPPIKIMRRDLPFLCMSVHNQPWTGPNIFLALLNAIMTYAASVGINTFITTSTTVLPAPNVVRRTYRWWL
jgi:hypothetical protein